MFTSKNPNEYEKAHDGRCWYLWAYTRGEWVVGLLDEADVEVARQHQWSVQHAPNGRSYLFTSVRRAGGGQTAPKLHRLLTGAPAGMDVDHVDGNGLNNTRANLRVCSRAENMRNGTRALGVTGARGVTRHRRRFAARGRADGKTHYLGLFPTIEEAATAVRNFQDSVDPESYALARTRIRTGGGK